MIVFLLSLKVKLKARKRIMVSHVETAPTPALRSFGVCRCCDGPVPAIVYHSVYLPARPPFLRLLWYQNGVWLSY